ncbi:MAG: lasso peptide biosynthesis protein [Acetobacteraceae bacterium]|nr:lasso peptide biosynthesis protein [Acetobacteraceae bacterium]MBV8591167.1 lasso peptide biosynthesis protein [Acetobacteraceae bacterium]
MGEAKRRTATRAKAAEAKQAWEAGLSDRGRTVLRVAKRLGAALALPGACYRCAMFLRYHLVARHGIDGEAVVGFVNDGTDVAYSSHAWYEIDGLITDVALCRPEKPRFQKAGPVTILGPRDGAWLVLHLPSPAAAGGEGASGRSPTLSGDRAGDGGRREPPLADGSDGEER